MKKRLDILLTVTSTAEPAAEILALNMIPYTETASSSLYAERLDVSPDAMISDLKLYNSRAFNDNLYVDEYAEGGGYAIHLLKDHDENLVHHILSYMHNEMTKDGSEEVIVYVDNPMDWYYFAKLMFIDSNGGAVPSWIVPYPLDLPTFLDLINVVEVDNPYELLHDNIDEYLFDDEIWDSIKEDPQGTDILARSTRWNYAFVYRSALARTIQDLSAGEI